MLGLIKKFFFKPEKPKETPLPDKIAEGLHKKSEEFVNLVSQSFEKTKEELRSLREKTKDLLGTNYALGLKHMENGKISEAIFRFRFIKKFWPKSYDSYYYLSYCLALTDNRLHEAKKTLEELLQKEPNYGDKAKELLKNINHRLENKPTNE